MSGNLQSRFSLIFSTFDMLLRAKKIRYGKEKKKSLEINELCAVEHKRSRECEGSICGECKIVMMTS